jgi:hypothetical protein
MAGLKTLRAGHPDGLAGEPDRPTFLPRRAFRRARFGRRPVLAFDVRNHSVIREAQLIAYRPSCAEPTRDTADRPGAPASRTQSPDSRNGGSVPTPPPAGTASYRPAALPLPSCSAALDPARARTGSPAPEAEAASPPATQSRRTDTARPFAAPPRFARPSSYKSRIPGKSSNGLLRLVPGTARLLRETGSKPGESQPPLAHWVAGSILLRAKPPGKSARGHVTVK